MNTFLNNLSIKIKIRIISLSAIIIISSLSVGGYVFFLQIQQNISNMKDKEIYMKELSHNLIENINNINRDVLMLTILPKNQDSIINELNESLGEMNNVIVKEFTNLQKYLANQNNDDNTQTKQRQNAFNIFKKLKVRYDSYFQLAIALPSADKDDIIDVTIGLYDIETRMFEELELFAILADKRFYNRIATLQNDLTNISNIAIIIALISLFGFAYFGYKLKFTINHSLKILDSGIEDFFDFLSHKKDVVSDIKIPYNDELANIATHINTNIHKAELLIDLEHKFKAELEDQVTTLTKEIEDTQKEVVFTMGAIGERRSKETGNHVKRVAQYSKLLALKYGLNETEAELLKQVSPMHDIGKVGIPDAILNKPGRFNEDERVIMNTHAELGYDMLKYSNRKLLKMAAIVAYEHHEKWDGSGYPRGLKGEEIHIYGRITAIADVFDALGSSRVYKQAWDDEKIFALFKEESGKQFDPQLVDIFFKNIDEIFKIRDNLNE